MLLLLYSTTDDNSNWPKMDIRSSMIFSPIMRGMLSQEVIDKLTTTMELQVDLRVDERVLDINVRNIHENQEYMDNQSLEQILHSEAIQVDEKTSIPMFKHICRKWMTDARVERYQVVVQKQAEKRAKEYLNSLEKTLIERFGETMHNHVWIKTPNKKIKQNTSIHNNRQISINEDEDEILQTKIPQNKTAS